MRAIADELQAMLTIVQSLLTIVTMTLSIFVLWRVRKLILLIKGMPGDIFTRAQRGVVGAWNWLTGKKD